MKKKAYHRPGRSAKQHGEPTDEQVQINGAIYFVAPTTSTI